MAGPGDAAQDVTAAILHDAERRGTVHVFQRRLVVVRNGEGVVRLDNCERSNVRAGEASEKGVRRA